MGQTEIILLALAAVAIVILIWRSRREIASLKARRKKLGRPREDVLMGAGQQRSSQNEHTRPMMQKEEPRFRKKTVAEPSFYPSTTEEERGDTLSSLPPVYSVLEEENEKKKEEQKQKNQTVSATQRLVGQGLRGDRLPLDSRLEWILDIQLNDTRTFSLGCLESLRHEILALNLKLPWQLWHQSTRDQLYYPGHLLQTSSSHLIVSVALANRAITLDEVKASALRQVLEAVAAQYDARVRISQEVPVVVAEAQKIKKFVDFFDHRLDVRLAPKEPRTTDWTLEQVAKVATDLGFTSASGQFEYRLTKKSHEPEITLAISGQTGHLHLQADVPLLRDGGSDLRQYFAMMNHMACHLNATIIGAQDQPLSTPMAVYYAELVRNWHAQMKTGGVDAGSRRAHMLFSRSA